MLCERMERLYRRILGGVIKMLVVLIFLFYVLGFMISYILLYPDTVLIAGILTGLVLKGKWFGNWLKSSLHTLFEDLVKVFFKFTGIGNGKKHLIRNLFEKKVSGSEFSRSVLCRKNVSFYKGNSEEQQSMDKTDSHLEVPKVLWPSEKLIRMFSSPHRCDWEICEKPVSIGDPRKDRFKRIYPSSRNVEVFESPQISERCRKESRDVLAFRFSTYSQNLLNKPSEVNTTYSAYVSEEERAAFQPMHLRLTREELILAYTTRRRDELALSKSKSMPHTFQDWTGLTFLLTGGKVREYICLTILKPLLEQIDKINAKLAVMGLEGCQIGVQSIFSLKILSDSLPKEAFPSIKDVIPYLESTLNQEYLVYRLRELAQGYCMKEYEYDKGGTFHGRLWTKSFVTDAAIIAHLFCSYMDFQLPHGICLFGKKLFTMKYFKKAVSQQDPPKEGYFLYQYKGDPPLYSVVIEGVPYHVPEGRNNLFNAIALFFEYVKIKHGGVLENINLGPSGLNILWVLDR